MTTGPGTGTGTGTGTPAQAVCSEAVSREPTTSQFRPEPSASRTILPPAPVVPDLSYPLEMSPQEARHFHPRGPEAAAAEDVDIDISKDAALLWRANELQAHGTSAIPMKTVGSEFFVFFNVVCIALFWKGFPQWC